MPRARRKTDFLELPDSATLCSLLRYDGSSGKLYWRERGLEWFTDGRRTREGNANWWNGRFAGKEAGYFKLDGYISVRLLGENYLAHRLIMAMELGRDPGEIDHINGDKSDNRPENLREVSHAENMANQSCRADNLSGTPGVHFSKLKGKWQASIGRLGKQHHLGYYVNVADAVRARKAADVSFGFHPNHGRVARG